MGRRVVKQSDRQRVEAALYARLLFSANDLRIAFFVGVIFGAGAILGEHWLSGSWPW
jgi:hypothetical protein